MVVVVEREAQAEHVRKSVRINFFINFLSEFWGTIKSVFHCLWGTNQELGRDVSYLAYKVYCTAISCYAECTGKRRKITSGG